MLGARLRRVTGKLQSGKRRHPCGGGAARGSDAAAAAALPKHGTEIDSLARCDEVRRPVQDDPRDIAARGGRKLFSLINELPELAADLDVSARGSAHVPAKRRRIYFKRHFFG